MIAADGSSIRVPESKETLAYFGRFHAAKDNENMPLIARISLFVDLCTSLVCSARITPWSTGERTSAEEQLSEVVSLMRARKQPKMMFIYDRGYASTKFIEQHQNLGVDFIFRLSSATYIHLWKRVKAGEHDFDDSILMKSGAESLKVRVVGVKLNTGEMEVLITSLPRETFNLKDISKAYILRWHIEECYKRLKVGAELENFSGKKMECVLQEFWAHLVVCNTLSLYMCDHQGAWSPDRVSGYRLNFCVLFGSLREILHLAITAQIDSKTVELFFKRAAMRARCKIRPDRLYSRRTLGKPKRHHVFRRVF